MTDPITCIECGEEVEEDESPGVWVHVERERDLDHTAIPDNREYGHEEGH